MIRSFWLNAPKSNHDSTAQLKREDSCVKKSERPKVRKSFMKLSLDNLCSCNAECGLIFRIQQANGAFMELGVQKQCVRRGLRPSPWKSLSLSRLDCGLKQSLPDKTELSATFAHLAHGRSQISTFCFVESYINSTIQRNAVTSCGKFSNYIGAAFL